MGLNRMQIIGIQFKEALITKYYLNSLKSNYMKGTPTPIVICRLIRLHIFLAYSSKKTASQ